MDCARNRLLGHLVRLQCTIPGRRLLGKLDSSSESQAAPIFRGVRELLADDYLQLPVYPRPRTPLWMRAAIVYHSFMPRMKRKEKIKDRVLRSFVEDVYTYNGVPEKKVDTNKNSLKNIFCRNQK